MLGVGFDRVLPNLAPIGGKSARTSRRKRKDVGDPSRIRTCNPRSRNPLLYPVELWDRWRLYIIANMKNPLLRQARPEPFSVSQRQSLKRWTIGFGPPLTQCCAAAGFRRDSRARPSTNDACDFFAPLFHRHE